MTRNPDPFLSAAVLIFLALLIARVCRPDVNIDQLGTMGGAAITGLFALLRNSSSPSE